jgi:hypothetical protein
MLKNTTPQFKPIFCKLCGNELPDVLEPSVCDSCEEKINNGENPEDMKDSDELKREFLFEESNN